MITPIVLEQQLAVVGAQLRGVHAQRRQQVDGLVEQRAARHRDRQAVDRRSCRHPRASLEPSSAPVRAPRRPGRCAGGRRRARSRRRAARARSGRAARRSARRRRAARRAPGRRPRRPRPCSSRCCATRPRSKITRSATPRLQQLVDAAHARRRPPRRGPARRRSTSAPPRRLGHAQQQLGVARRVEPGAASARLERRRSRRGASAVEQARRALAGRPRALAISAGIQRGVAEADAVVLQAGRVQRVAEHRQRLGGALRRRARRSARSPPAAARAAGRAAGARRGSSGRSSRSAAAARRVG